MNFRLIRLFLLSVFLCWIFPSNGQPERLGKIDNFPDTAKIMETITRNLPFVHTQPEKMRPVFIETLMLSLQSGYYRGVRNSLGNLAVIDMTLNRHDSALSHLKQLLKYSDTLKTRSALAIAYTLEGTIYHIRSEYQKAFESYSKAYYYGSDSFSLASQLYINMGEVLTQTRGVEKALPYFDKSIQIARQHEEKSMLGIALRNKGKALNELKIYDQSELYLDSAIAIAQEEKDYELWYEALIFKSKLYNQSSRPQQALNTISQAPPIIEKLNAAYKRQYLYYVQLGEIYLQLHQYRAAEQNLQKALALGRTAGSDRAIILLNLSNLYATTGNYKNAYNYYLESQHFSDSVNSLVIQNKIHELETQYRTIEKDKIIAQQRARAEEARRKLAIKNSQILAITGATIIILLLILWWHFNQRRKLRHEKEIEHLKGVISGEEAERSRFARDLHDGINSQLTAIQSFLLAAAQKNPALNDSHDYKSAQTLLIDTASGVRSIAHNLSPEILLQKGLAATLQHFCEGIFSAAGIECDLQLYGDFTNINESLALDIYRIVQELAQNIVKHAAATHVSVLVSRTNDEISITVEDDGKGMARTNIPDIGGIGLRTIRQRVDRHNGKLAIDSIEGVRTCIHIVLPLPSLYPAKESDSFII